MSGTARPALALPGHALWGCPRTGAYLSTRHNKTLRLLPPGGPPRPEVSDPWARSLLWCISRGSITEGPSPESGQRCGSKLRRVPWERAHSVGLRGTAGGLAPLHPTWMDHRGVWTTGSATSGGGAQPYPNAGATELSDVSGPTPAESNLSGLGCNLGLRSFSSSPGDSNARPG